MNISIKNLSRYKKYFKIIKRIILKKPLVLFRVLKNYFKIIILRKKIVRKVEMGITFDCQCNCPKCSSDFMRGKKEQELTLEEIKKAADEIIALGAAHINLTGGEPLMHDNIFEIIKCFHPKKVVITINTNGLLLNEDMIDKLDKAGVDIFKISIDSPIEEEHDKSRVYKGCFKQAVRALRYIKSKDSIIGQISTVCIKENLNSSRIWKLVKMAKDFDALLGLTIPAAAGRWIDDGGVLIGEEERKVLRKLIRIPHVIRDTDEAYLRSHCPAGSEEFYLTCYGDIIPCPLIQISFGNVKNESLKSIWNRMLEFEPFKNKKKLGCLAGEDKEFIQRYLLPLKDHKRLPVPINDIN